VLVLDPGTFLRLRTTRSFPYVEDRLERLVAGLLPPAADSSP